MLHVRDQDRNEESESIYGCVLKEVCERAFFAQQGAQSYLFDTTHTHIHCVCVVASSVLEIAFGDSLWPFVIRQEIEATLHSSHAHKDTHPLTVRQFLGVWYLGRCKGQRHAQAICHLAGNQDKTLHRHRARQSSWCRRRVVRSQPISITTRGPPLTGRRWEIFGELRTRILRVIWRSWQPLRRVTAGRIVSSCCVSMFL